MLMACFFCTYRKKKYSSDFLQQPGLWLFNTLFPYSLNIKSSDAFFCSKSGSGNPTLKSLSDFTKEFQGSQTLLDNLKIKWTKSELFMPSIYCMGCLY